MEGGSERVVFRLLVEMERLEATFNFESCSAPPLLLAAIEDVHFNLTIHPDSLLINAALGNMRAQDGVLPEVQHLHFTSKRLLVINCLCHKIHRCLRLVDEIFIWSFCR